ncbi:MAG: hypothetical protein OXD01_13700 [Gammaproteobacteria bacterium]|nr:hypothetical protein [Gammaproteobacteria bacterium]
MFAEAAILPCVPFFLHIVAGTDIQHAQCRIKVAHQCYHAKGNVGFAHTYLISQITDPDFGIGNHVIEGNGSLQLQLAKIGKVVIISGEIKNTTGSSQIYRLDIHSVAAFFR